MAKSKFSTFLGGILHRKIKESQAQEPGKQPMKNVSEHIIEPKVMRPEMLIRQLLSIADRVEDIAVVARVDNNTVVMASTGIPANLLVVGGNLMVNAGVAILNSPQKPPPPQNTEA